MQKIVAWDMLAEFCKLQKKFEGGMFVCLISIPVFHKGIKHSPTISKKKFNYLTYYHNLENHYKIHKMILWGRI